jgi:hypothetical protein
VTLDGEFEIEDPITEKLAIYTLAHVSFIKAYWLHRETTLEV